jgi:hypothetical protein
MFFNALECFIDGLPEFLTESATLCVEPYRVVAISSSAGESTRNFTVLHPVKAAGE